MRTTYRRTAAALAALLFWAGASSVSRAGFFIGWGEYDRQLQPGAVIPYDAAPFSERYNYHAGPAFYLDTGNYYDHLVYMDYLDRLDRARRVGLSPAGPAALPRRAALPALRPVTPGRLVVGAATLTVQRYGGRVEDR